MSAIKFVRLCELAFARAEEARYLAEYFGRSVRIHDGHMVGDFGRG